jgi:hypothetical protein
MAKGGTFAKQAKMLKAIAHESRLMAMRSQCSRHCRNGTTRAFQRWDVDGVSGWGASSAITEMAWMGGVR